MKIHVGVLLAALMLTWASGCHETKSHERYFTESRMTDLAKVASSLRVMYGVEDLNDLGRCLELAESHGLVVPGDGTRLQVDYWGTPFALSFESRFTCEVGSAGEDRKFGTADDISVKLRLDWVRE